MTMADDIIEALGRVAYERYVEGMEGTIDTPVGPMGLPPWTSPQGEEQYELPADEKEVWGRVAASVFSHFAAKQRVITITPAMVDAARRTEWLDAQSHDLAVRRVLTAALEAAGFTVIEAPSND